MPARTISLVNFKGGVGKTSLAVNLAACLAHTLSQRVLLVDCDLQSNSSIWLLGFTQWNFLDQQRGRSIGGSFITKAVPLRERIITRALHDRVPKGPIHKLDLLPATYELFDFEESNLEPDFFVRIGEELNHLRDEYDYIIFDCPPNLFKASKTAIFASREIYVPCNPNHLSAIGLNLLIGKLTRFYREIEQFGLPLPRDYEHARIVAGILNDVNFAANHDPIVGMMNLLLSQNSEAIYPGAAVLPQRIRSTVTAAGVFAKNLPVVIATGIAGAAFAGLRQDYIEVAKRIHHHQPPR